MAWLDEAILMLRLTIGDLDCDPDFDDTRLGQMLILAGKYIIQEMPFDNDYEISLMDMSVSPDPLTEGDTAFINFAVLKASCMLDFSTAKAKANLEGIRAALGPVNLSVSGHVNAFLKILEVGACKTYEEMKKQWLFGEKVPIRAVMSPFVSNTFDIRHWRTGSGGDSARFY